MERILMALFGGGELDWQEISKTNYDWEEIINKARQIYGLDTDITCLFEFVFRLAKNDFCNMINDYIKSYNEDKLFGKEIEILKNFDFENEENWYFNCNCLDNDIILYVNEETKKAIDEIVDIKDLNAINDKIGFNEIKIEVV